MRRINWLQVFVGGLVAGVVWTILSSIVTVVVGHDFAAAVPGNRLAAPNASFVAFLLALNLAEGIWAMWLYAAILPRYGRGLRTAGVVGSAWWVVSSLIDATWGSFGFVPASALLGPMLGSLPAIIEVRIDAAGRVTESCMLRGVREDVDLKALEAVKAWRFEPPRLLVDTDLGGVVASRPGRRCPSS